MERFKGVVVAIRNIRAELNVPLDSRPPVLLASTQPAVRTFFQNHQPLLQALASIGAVSVEAARQRAKQAAATVVDGVEVLIPLAGLIDAGRERQRLQQRVDELMTQLSQLERRLRDKQFIRKAPNEVVDQTKARRAQARQTLKKFSDHLSVLQSM